MELTGSKVIRADRATVWAGLNSAEVLQASIPGCTALTGSPQDGFEAEVTQKVGPVKATFKGKVTLSDIVETEGYTISGEGSGGAAGFAKGGAKVRLADHAEGTELSYEVDAKVGGKIAQLGARLIDSFAKKMADEFFTRFQAAVEGEAEGDATSEAQPDSGEAGELADPAPKKGLLKRIFG